MRRAGHVLTGGVDVVHEPDDHGEHVAPVFFDVHRGSPDRRRDAHGAVGKEIRLETLDDIFGPYRRQRDIGRDGRNRRRQGLDHAGDVDDELLVGFLDLEEVYRIPVKVRISAHPDGGQHADQMQAELLAQVGERSDAEFVGVVADRQGVAVFGAVDDAELHDRFLTAAVAAAVRAASRKETPGGSRGGNAGPPRLGGARNFRRPPGRRR